jgi:hypothetical protein
MMQQYTINTEELEKHIAEKKLEETRKTRERIFLTSLVLCCMVALYVVFHSMNQGNGSEFRQEVKFRQPRFESQGVGNTPINKAPTFE